MNRERTNANWKEHLTSAVVNGKLYAVGGRTAGMAANVNVNEVC